MIIDKSMLKNKVLDFTLHYNYVENYGTKIIKHYELSIKSNRPEVTH